MQHLLAGNDDCWLQQPPLNLKLLGEVLVSLEKWGWDFTTSGDALCIQKRYTHISVF